MEDGWKTVTFDTTERELAVRDIGFRAEQPLNSVAYKEAVLPTILREVDDENAGPPFHMHSCGCLNGRFELKATDEYWSALSCTRAIWYGIAAAATFRRSEANVRCSLL